MISVALVDDEMPALKELKYLLGKYDEVNIIGMFMNPLEALAFVEKEKPDAVFLDIDMPVVNGIEFALKIQDINIGTEIIFVTAYQEYAIQAFEMQAMDYVLKPLANERFNKTIERLIRTTDLKKPQVKEDDLLWIQCFGKFKLINKSNTGEILKWRTNKVKELFAYLISNYGRTLSKNDLIYELFNDFNEKKALNNLYVSMYYLRKQLNEFGLKRDSILLREDYTLEIGEGICDYVDFDRFSVNGPVCRTNVLKFEKTINLYKGPFLDDVDYLWSFNTKEYIHAKYEDLVFLLTDYYESVKEFHKSEDILIHLIEVSPYCEEGYYRLLDIYIKNENHRLFKKYYKALELLQEEFEIIINDKYKNHYLIIKGLL